MIGIKISVFSKYYKHRISSIKIRGGREISFILVKKNVKLLFYFGWLDPIPTNLKNLKIKNLNYTKPRININYSLN